MKTYLVESLSEIAYKKKKVCTYNIKTYWITLYGYEINYYKSIFLQLNILIARKNYQK